MKHSWMQLSLYVAAVLLVLSCSIRPAAAAEAFRAGDPFVVAQQGAPLMRGPNTLARLSMGQRLNVLKTEGDWVGTRAMVNGQAVDGWVYKRQVATPAQYAARRATRRSYSFQPGAPTGGYTSGGASRSYSRSSNRGFTMGLTPYGPSYWRADRKIAGY